MDHPNSDQQTTLLFIRHTDVHNPGDVLYGRLPRFGLSDLGLRQAEVTARALAEEPVSVFYSSPQLRARQTVRILAGPHPDAPVHVTKLLAEVLTAWQGRPHSQLEAHGFNFYANRLHESDEHLEDVWQRIERFVKLARKRHAGGTVVAVTHGDPVIITRAVYSGMPLSIESLRQPHVYPGKGSILRLAFGPDQKETYPLSLEYYDPNGEGARWSDGPVQWRGGEAMPA